MMTQPSQQALDMANELIAQEYERKHNPHMSVLYRAASCARQAETLALARQLDKTEKFPDPALKAAREWAAQRWPVKLPPHFRNGGLDEEDEIQAFLAGAKWQEGRK